MLKKYPCTMQHDQSDCAAAVVSTVLLSLAVCLSIFTITSIITWNSINKAKAIDVLKGK